MEDSSKKGSGLWVWIVIALIVAALVVATLFYIGWFNNNTHVDSLNGDNVMDTYQIEQTNAEEPGTADWENAEHRNLNELITEPEADNGSQQQ